MGASWLNINILLMGFHCKCKSARSVSAFVYVMGASWLNINILLISAKRTRKFPIMSFRTVTGWLSIEILATLTENKIYREACILFCMMFLACAQSQFDIELLLLNKCSSDAELLRKENVAHKVKESMVKNRHHDCTFLKGRLFDRMGEIETSRLFLFLNFRDLPSSSDWKYG